MDRQLFLETLERLKKDDTKPELWRFLKLWMREGKSKLEVAQIIRKKTDLKNPNDVTIFSRRLKTVCEYFGIKVEGKGTHEAQLAYLFRKHVPDFVHPNVCPDAVDSEILNRPQSPTNPKNVPTPESIPELTTLEFIGRDRDLANLTNLSRQAKIVLIKAGAGVGKSTLAREFLQTQFKKVIRLEMGLESGNVTPAEEKVSQILRKDFDEEPSRDFGINLDILREKLADRANPIGVLIDNLEPALDENYRFREKLRGYDALLAVLGDRDVFSFTLITSRRSLIAPRARVHEYSLEGLDITAWRQYFHDCENGVDSEALLQMRDAYNGNAKVMDILHGAIKNRFDGNIGAYWNRYKDALLADSELETLISVEMDWLRDNQPDAYKLLCRMGCYRYQDVKNVPFEGLICLLWDVSESKKIGVVDYLSKSSLIEAKGGYYLHPAIRESAKIRLLKHQTDWERVNHQAAEFWTNSIQTVVIVDDALKAFEAYYHYVDIGEFDLASSIIVMGRDNNWEKMEHLGRSFYRLGMLEQMINSIDKVISFTKDLFYLSAITNILGDLYWLTGNFQKAIRYHSQSKSLVDRCLSFDIFHSYSEQQKDRLSNLYISSFTNRGLCNLDVWELKKAKEIFHEAIKARTEVIEKYNFNPRSQAITSNSCLGLIYAILGERDKAISCLQIAEEIFESYSEYVNSWAKGYGLIFCATSYKYLNDFQKSLKLYSQAIIYAKQSYYTQVQAKALIGIATIDYATNRFSDAIEKCISSINILKKLGAKPDLAEAYFQLGLTYQAMGEHEQAEEYKAKALELFAQMEAPKQIERVNKAFGGNIQ